MLFLGRNLRPRVLLQHDAFVANKIEQSAILIEADLFVVVRFRQNIVDIVLVRFKQRSDFERRVSPKCRNVLAGQYGVRLRLRGLRPQP